eukprot:COSAG01_NODE_4365_length_5094_cov_1.949750_8_plen_192_part_00
MALQPASAPAILGPTQTTAQGISEATPPPPPAYLSSPAPPPPPPPLPSPPVSSAADGAVALAEMLLEQQRLTHAQEATVRQEMLRQMEQMRHELALARTSAAISGQRLGSLQARCEVLHAAQLLTDDEVHALEDLIADYLELQAVMMAGGGVVAEMAHASEAVAKLLKLVGLSEGIAADGAFARQVRRKCL